MNNVLKDASAGRIAVIVNEFGEAGLDHGLIEGVEDEIILMESGCLCCSLRGDLSQTMSDLLNKRDQEEFEFDRIMIEKTGVAEPGPILKTLTVDQALQKTVRLDGIVTVVDAANGQATLDAQFEAVTQADLADLILLSKTDLVEPAVADALTVRLCGLNSTADILRPVKGSIAPETLWGGGRSARAREACSGSCMDDGS